MNQPHIGDDLEDFEGPSDRIATPQLRGVVMRQQHEKELTEENIQKLYVALLKEREALQQVVPSAQSAMAAIEAKKEQAESELADERAKREALELENQQLRAFRDMYSSVIKDLHSEQTQLQEEMGGVLMRVQQCTVHNPSKAMAAVETRISSLSTGLQRISVQTQKLESLLS